MGNDNNALWEIVRSEKESVSERSNALGQLCSNGNQNVPAYVLAELQKRNISSNWLFALTTAIEDSHISDPTMRRNISAALLHIINGTLQSGNKSVLETVGSGATNFGTITGFIFRSFALTAIDEDAGMLIPYVGHENPNIMQGAQKAIITIFTGNKAHNPADFPELKEAVYKSAQKQIAQTARTPKEVASFSITAQTMVSLADERFSECLSAFCQSDDGWIREYLLKRLGGGKSSFASQVDGCAKIALDR